MADRFPGTGAHLERYAGILNCAEINSSFHRPHATKVYEKWASITPPGFRFAVKMPRTITHDAKLKRTRPLVQRFLDESRGLGGKLGPVLVQLPPSLEFHARTAHAFFTLLRETWAGDVVCEPRHETWFTDKSDALLVDYRVARVAADPPRIAAAQRPGGWPGMTYYRLHGSPRTYWSRYPTARIGRWAADLRAAESCSDTWCIFDNTASGAAIENALEMVGLTAG
ncbi:MAG TPA: DUF72 domain-containing protein [Gemmatimonadaceae bacterium]|nr:DUF72 domain-containing protein [Gemmatimonadaceae bacterium]